MAVKRKPAVYKTVPLGSGIDRVVYDTRFDRSLDARDIPPAHLAVASGHRRQYIHKVRSAEIEPTVKIIRDLTAGAIVIANDETITALDLFDLTPNAEAIAVARARDEANEGPARRHDLAVHGFTRRRKRS